MSPRALRWTTQNVPSSGSPIHTLIHTHSMIHKCSDSISAISLMPGNVCMYVCMYVCIYYTGSSVNMIRITGLFLSPGQDIVDTSLSLIVIFAQLLMRLESLLKTSPKAPFCVDSLISSLFSLPSIYIQSDLWLLVLRTWAKQISSREGLDYTDRLCTHNIF